jgi:hypothetical protein
MQDEAGPCARLSCLRHDGAGIGAYRGRSSGNSKQAGLQERLSSRDIAWSRFGRGESPVPPEAGRETFVPQAFYSKDPLHVLSEAR